MSRNVEREELQKRFDMACRRAKKKQEANRKIRERYTSDKRLQASIRKKLIEDLIRVYNHPDNPYAGFAASRARYRDLGHYPEIMVTDFMGNHQEFLRAAGLYDLRNTTRSRNAIARLHTAMQVAEFAKENVTRWVGGYQKADKRGTDLEVIVASDLHSYFVDPFALDVLIDTVRMVEPDVVVLNGDVVDFPQISRHRQLPGHFLLNLQEEIDFAREKILRRVREAAPNAQIDFVLGNHEYRLVTYLADTAPQLASLRSLQFGPLFGLDDYEVNLACRSNFLAPTKADRKKDRAENWHIIGDTLVATHGTSCARFAAAEQMRRFQMCGTSGHTHRPQIVCDNSLGTGPLSWTSTPMMASFSVGRDYVAEPSQWNMGFGVFSVMPRKRLVCPNLVIVHEEWASFAGRRWVPSKAAISRRAEQWRIGA